MNFNLSRPCGNCPFLRVGAIELQRGRLDGIIADVMRDDFQTFQCHKTVHGPHGGEWDDDGQYTASGHESACMGAVAFQWKAGRPSVLTRLAIATGMLNAETIQACAALVIDAPPRGSACRKRR